METGPKTSTPAPNRYEGRIGGLDIARALAIFGMFYAHVAPSHDDVQGLRGIILAIPDGRSSILFALLAGVSVAILTGRNVPYGGERMRTARLRIFARAAVLLVIAGFLSVLGTQIAVILGFYAAWFVAALPFTRLGPRTLLAIAAAWAIIGPTLLPLITWVMENLGLWESGDANGFVVNTFISGHYPGLTYMAYVIAGMGIGRLDATARRVQKWLLAAGTGLALVGYGLSAALTSAFVNPFINDDGPSLQPSWTPLHPEQWLVAEPHSNTPFEAIASGGVGIAIIGLCLLGGALARNVLYPVAASGSMSLSAYTFHVLIVAFHPEWIGGASWAPVLWLIGGTIIVATAWKHYARRGPLEWIMWKVSMKAAS
ncbi:heparan-alpha-glucosaminide N-acetyltransferase domain-containing protein [Ancrocorticia populi]|uniref:Uncharacterized protein n=1 Tax=Ancrocorticia populi TaxID=2175228 RepID=A0A2V1K4L9_9ACTO|nr:heparan-alpha-glucosaminide N-acetyltransferase domain-containing protein [Ancrocorticia populi]PWF26213.1 hypothetical protein DD236_09115 [Ancrocorticia populi]